jgi:ornithine carbamoyltransferase
MAMKRDLLSVTDLAVGEVQEIFRLAKTLKGRRGPEAPQPLLGQTIALLFQHPSLRTKASFDVAVHELGAHPLYMGNDEVKMGTRESPADVARVLSRYVQGVVARLRSHAELQAFADAATVPVVNALTDGEHPCQALADLLTLDEHSGGLAGRHLVYIGDADNNVATSLLLLAPRLGVQVTIVCPAAYAPSGEVLAHAKRLGGAPVVVEHDPQRVNLAGADAIYTDVWVSMGQDAETAARKAALMPYQVNAALLQRAPERCIVLHCLPAKRGQEITDAVLDGPQSAVFDQAENRLHVQKALLQWLLAGR